MSLKQWQDESLFSSVRQGACELMEMIQAPCGHIQYNNHIKTKIKGEIIEFDFDKIYNEYELSNIL